ncbi:MAG TPA: alpha/beta hydrolase [Nocardioidaceae bacterium]|nr:alpha/beta hydrolase [Nocardioidaceae bacterium]
MSDQSTAPAARSDTVAESEELFAEAGDGIRLCYQTYGDPSDAAMLLIMGLGGPMTWWDPDLCRMLAGRGFFVIRYDNRDTGRSSRASGRISTGDLLRGFLGARTSPPYTLDDMADDAFGLLDHLEAPAAHVVGVSMGGMIAQTMAVLRPDRVRSLTSIMSTTGRRTVGWQSPRLLPGMLSRRGSSKEEYVAASAALWKLIGSPAYPETRETTPTRAAETWERGVSNAGVLRQMAAILAQPDRTSALGRLSMPALVVHGTSDRMVHRSGGRATAAAIPGCELLLLPGMGHDLPIALHSTFADAITRTARRA